MTKMKACACDSSCPHHPDGSPCMEAPVKDSGFCQKCEDARYVRDGAKAKAENEEKEKRRLDIPAKDVPAKE
jgi:hypothetical protein